MPGPSSGGVDSAVRVVVTPSQSSYFAGEPFSVTITFTNTRSPEAGPSRSFSHSHKRGAHSISSAPLARPPTSPGTPRTAVPVLPTRTRSEDDGAGRKGLVGAGRGLNGSGELSGLIEQRRKKQLAKSLSVSIAPHDLKDELGEGTLVKSASLSQRAFHDVQYDCKSRCVFVIPVAHTKLCSPNLTTSAFSPRTITQPSTGIEPSSRSQAISRRWRTPTTGHLFTTSVRLVLAIHPKFIHIHILPRLGPYCRIHTVALSSNTLAILSNHRKPFILYTCTRL